MALPDLVDATGDLPVGVHRATLGDVVERFGAPEGARAVCTLRLAHVHRLAESTGHLQRFVIFGSYVTAKPAPNDVDVILVMDDLFQLELLPPEVRGLFDHGLAQARYGVSVFWTRPGLTLGGDIEEFIRHWQIKRDGTQRGIVEVIA